MIGKPAGKGEAEAVTMTKHTIKRRLSKSHIRKWGFRLIHFVLVFGICFIILYPLIVKFCTAFKSPNDLLDKTVIYVPREFTLTAIQNVFRGMNYPQALLNTLGISLLVSGLAVASCTLVGYGFGRFQFPLKRFWFAMVILTMIIPPQVVFLPTYLHFRNFDILGLLGLFGLENGVSLINNPGSFAVLGITAMGFKNGLYIYMIQQFFRGLPKELEEAAHVDGAGHFRTFFRIFLPSAGSITGTVFLFSFIWQWTDTYYTQFFMPNAELLSNALLNIGYQITSLGTNSTLSAASPAALSQINNIGCLLVIIPLLVLYAFTQKIFVEGVERSGIVG